GLRVPGPLPDRGGPVRRERSAAGRPAGRPTGGLPPGRHADRAGGSGRMNLRNPFRTLRYRNFRLLWTGEVLRTSSQWMDTITRAFLVWELTGSETHLALVTAVRSAPLFVVGLIAGVLADRIDRKRLLMSSQSLSILANLAVAGLIATGWIQLWQVYLTVLIVGFSMSVNQPARQSMLPSLVPATDLQAAVVLNTATLNIGQAIGPVIGGMVVGAFGLAPAFVVQALMVLGAGVLISRIRLPPAKPRPKQSWAESAGEGLRYVLRHRLLGALFLISVAPMIFIQPFRGVVPAITVEQLMADATVTGMLMAVLGVGALASVLALASLPPPRYPWRRILLSCVVSGVALAVFALSHQLVVTAAALFVLGMSQANNRTLTQALQLAETEDALRGRVSSLWVRSEEHTSELQSR